MEEPVLTLDSTRLRAEPGGQTQLSVTVRNPGHLVESFRLDVLGLDPSWCQVHPPELPVYPGKEESAIVVLSPPADSQAPEQALPFAVRAVSTLDPDRSVVEEGDLEIGRILDLQAAIVPVTARGRWSARYRVTYTNWGNSTMHLRLSVTDKDEALGFRLAPEQVTVPVGGSATARVRVRPRKPFLRGVAVHRPFQVIAESGGFRPPPGTPRSAAARAGVPDAGRPVLDGALQQQPIVSRSVLMLAGLLVVVAGALVAMVLRSAGVKGATTDDVPPDKPAGVRADAVSDALVRLRWAPVDRATTYEVRQVDPTDGALLKTTPVAGGATVLDVPVDQPNDQVCFVVVAIRDGDSPASGRSCTTTRDGRLPPPKNVQAVLTGAEYLVSWNDSDQNDHVVLVDGAPVGQPSPAGVTSVAVSIAAGRHSVQVVGRLGTTKSSQPSAPVFVDSAGLPTPTATASTGSTGAASTATVTATPSTGSTGVAALTGWIAIVGPQFQQSDSPTLRADFLQQVQATGATAQLVPSSQLPQLNYKAGAIVVVVTGFVTQQAATDYCAGVPATLTTECRAVQVTS